MTETAETVTQRDPRDFLYPELTPLATWTLKDLSAALGNQAVAELWGVTTGNARQVRYRGTASLERMQALQDAVRQDEPRYREALVTIYSTGAFRRQS